MAVLDLVMMAEARVALRRGWLVGGRDTWHMASSADELIAAWKDKTNATAPDAACEYTATPGDYLYGM